MSVIAVAGWMVFWGGCGSALAQRRNRDTTMWAILAALFPPNLLLLALLPTLNELEGAAVACGHCGTVNRGIDRTRGRFDCTECGEVTKFRGPASWPA